MRQVGVYVCILCRSCLALREVQEAQQAVRELQQQLNAAAICVCVCLFMRMHASLSCLLVCVLCVL